MNSRLLRIRAWLQTSPLRAELIRGSGGAFLAQSAGALATLALNLLLARFLGAKQYGNYAYLMACVNVLMIVSLLGFPMGLVRYVAAYRARAEWPLLRGLLHRSAQLVIGVAFLVAGLFIFGAFLIRGSITTDLFPTVAVLAAAALVPLFAVISLCEAIFQGLKRVVLANLPLSVMRPLVVCLLVLASIAVFRQTLTASQTLVITGIAACLVLGWTFRRLLLTLPKNINNIASRYETRRWLLTSLPLLFLAGMQIILSQTDTLMLGALRGPEAAGVYYVASRVANLIIFGLWASNAIVAPLISELHATDRHRELQSIVRLTARYVSAFALVAGILIAIFGKPVLELFGSEFVAAYPALVILVAGQIINALAGPVGYLMTMTGHQNPAAVILGVAAGVNVVANFVAIPLAGVSGAAMATAGSLILWNVLMAAYVWRRMSINSTVL